MNGDRAGSAALVDGIVAGLDAAGTVGIVVCPPAVHIAHVVQRVGSAPLSVGGQNLCEHREGAYTGEISGAMLADAGCTYCIVGHSERRALYGESSAVVAAKFRAALESGLVPILCVGETLDDRESNRTETVIGAQLDAVMRQAGVEQFTDALVAYEPVWAIGTGRTATPEQAQDVHSFIRARIAASNRRVAEGLRVLYGGSVKPDNAGGLFSQPDIDGGLIGGASLNADQFMTICSAWPTLKG